MPTKKQWEEKAKEEEEEDEEEDDDDEEESDDDDDEDDEDDEDDDSDDEEESDDEETSSEEEEEAKPAVKASKIPAATPTAPIVPRRKFDDEDAGHVADNWEEAEDSEVEREKAAKAAAAKAKADAEAAANKKSKSQRIEEHREAGRRRRAAEEQGLSSEGEDEATKRARLRRSEQDSDLKHAQDLLENVGLGPKNRTASKKGMLVEDKSNPGHTIDLSTLALFKPSTKADFDNLSHALTPLITSSSHRPHYALWLPDFMKKLAADLPSTEIKKAASALTALSNEKLKDEKAMEKGGKKTKAAKNKSTLAAGRDVGRGRADVTSYEDELGDDDFM